MQKLSIEDKLRNKRCRVSKSNLKNEIANRLKKIITLSTSQSNLITYKISIGEILPVEDIVTKSCVEARMAHKSQFIKIKTYVYGLNSKDYIAFKTLCENDELLSIIDFKIDGISHTSPIINLKSDIERLNKIEGLKISIITNESFFGIFFARKIVKNIKYFNIVFEISYDDLKINKQIIDQEMSKLKNRYSGLVIIHNPYLSITETLLKSKFNFNKADINKLRNNNGITKSINSSNVESKVLKNFLMNLLQKYNSDYKINDDFIFFINKL